jgi:CBS domain-containing protein
MTFLTDSIMTSNLITVEENKSIEVAESLMKLYNIRHLPVVDIENELLGILSAKDVAAAENKTKAVKSVMSPRVRIIKQNSNIKKIIEYMLKFKISSMLVANNNELVGIVTTDDLLQLLYELLDEGEHVNSSEVPNLLDENWTDEDDDHVLSQVGQRSYHNNA